MGTVISKVVFDVLSCSIRKNACYEDEQGKENKLNNNSDNNIFKERPVCGRQIRGTCTCIMHKYDEEGGREIERERKTESERAINVSN